jgi:hypothetical protein
MAHIRKHGEKFRAEVQKHGQRVTKVLDTMADVRLWVEHTEAALDAQCVRHEPRLVPNGPDLVTMVPKQVLDACRQVPHNHIAILEAAIPTSKASGVYFLIRGGEVAYVGQSVDVLHRIARHRREGKLFDAFSYIECDRDDMDRLETLYIKALVPLENLSFGNHREQRPRLDG